MAVLLARGRCSVSPRIGALFAGYGGLEMGVQAAIGGTVAWHAEIDPAPSRVLAHHWPTVPNLGDVTTADWSSVEPVDVITGGSPCQDLSHAGKRAGMKAGTRSGLWASMCDAIDIIRPSLVIWENVRGAYSAEADSAVEPCPLCVGDRPGPTLRALGRVLGDLAELGFDAEWTGVRASDVGAPHGRYRVFLAAWPASDTDRIGREWARRARDGRSGPADGDQRTDLILLPTPAVNDMGASYTPESWDAWTQAMQAKHDGSLYAATGIAMNDAVTRRASDFGQYAPAIRRWESLTRTAPAPTEPTGRDGAHRLSPTFVEWMMGLPDGHVTDPAIWDGWLDTRGKPTTASAIRNAQLKALGNGVVPQQAAHAVRTLLALAGWQVAA